MQTMKIAKFANSIYPDEAAYMNGIKILEKKKVKRQIRSRGYKTFFMLNSAKYDIFPAYKCWHFNIYEQEK